MLATITAQGIVMFYPIETEYNHCLHGYNRNKRPVLFHNQNSNFAEALNGIIMLEFQITHMRVTNIFIMCYEYMCYF